jgi:hypothetical protein
MNKTTEANSALIKWDPTPAATEAEAAAATALYAEFELRVRRAANLTPAYLETDKSGTYRFGGQVRIIPALKRFEILVRPEATQGDLWFLEGIVDDVRAGLERSIPFREHPLTSRPSETFKVLSPGRAVDPNAPRLGRGTQFLIDCEEQGCIDFGGFHAWESLDNPAVEHIHERIEHDGYEVRVNMMSREKDWRVEIFNTGDLARFTPAGLGSFMNDLQWAVAEVRKLNAA